MALTAVFLTLLLGIITSYAVKLYLQFTRHLAEAKASGIPYIIVPFYYNNRFYQLCSLVLLPILHRLPSTWTESWLCHLEDWFWSERYTLFERMGADTFLIVSPERLRMTTADANVIAQITNRRNDFPKPIEVYGMLRLYGDNVVVKEGQEWRHHRKITSAPFSEKNNHLVWQESLDLAQTMVESWFEDSKAKETRTLKRIADDAMRLSLHVISKAGFGIQMIWPERGNVSRSEPLEHGHTMSYTDALATLLHHILWVLACPHILLKILPFATQKAAYKSFVEWGNYMSELLAKKKAEVLSNTTSDQLDLMIAMIKGANVTSDPSTQTLTDREIIGNAFVFLIAGHETTANSIQFCLVYLALNISSQRRLQRDLDSIFQGRAPDAWNYDRDVPQLFNSMAGAVLAEELRVMPPVVAIPKCTLPNTPQSMTINGRKCTIPGNTYIEMVSVAAHRNPNQWPTGPPAAVNSHNTSTKHSNDLEEFKPERWILDTDAKREAAKKLTDKSTPEINADEAAALGVNLAPDTAAGLYKPLKGAYLPFSEGYRACMGRRFAQVELLAVLALIFSQYSIELAVDEWASDGEVDAMDGQQKREVWEKARVEVERQLRDDLGTLITIQLRKGFFALRLVKRGYERFDF